MPHPFVPGDTKHHYAPDRPVAVEHVRLEVAIELDAKTISGRSTLTVNARAPQVAALNLHAVDMDIRAVRVDDVVVTDFHYDGLVVRIPLAAPRTRGARFTVAVDYSAQPQRGLYFLAPDATDPKRPLQCWTQGQDEDARFYFPCIDAPIEKATSEVLCTAPRGKLVLSNGKLLGREPAAGNRERWHYSLELPHSSYLISLVCGDFAVISSRAPETGTEVTYYGPPGREKDLERTLGKTPAMIDFFSRRIGIPYPHARYSQIVVADFIFGGMENTSATTLTDQALLDPRAALDHDMEALVAHELAHQWWGDLLTCREWSEAWLNEGFATYFEYVWHEHELGRDEADVRLLADLDAYLAEAGEYRRPIVCRQYREPIELFDAHLYEKGGRVLHMLRAELGDDVFFAALKLYGERHARGAVETRDLARAFEDASGRSFDRFFADWVTSPGHLELACAWEWDDDRAIGTLRVSQTQDPAKIYPVPLRLRFEVAGRLRDERVKLSERSHAFEFRFDKPPTQVIVDPGNVLLKTMKLEKSLPIWIRELAAADLGIDRVMAARALAEKHERKAVAALALALAEDRLWAVRAEAASALGKLTRQDALDALLAAHKDGHPKVRAAVAAALGKFVRDPRAGDALAAWVVRGDASYFVEGNAARALAQVRDPRALELMPRALERDAFMDVIRARALEGLGEMGGQGNGDPSTRGGSKTAPPSATAMDLLIAALAPRLPFQGRRAAATGLGKLARGTAESRRAREALEATLADRHFAVRSAAAGALAELRDDHAVPALEAALRAELDGRTRRRLGQALDALRAATTPTEELAKLREDLESLRTLSTTLRERVEKLEQGPTPPGGNTTPPGAGRPRGTASPPPVTRRPRPLSRRTGNRPTKPVPRRR